MNISSLINVSLIPILAATLFSCSEPEVQTETEPQDITLAFAAVANDEAVKCGADYSIGEAGFNAQLADARMFISEIEFENADGEWIPLALTTSDWQYENIGLLDFEDGTGACAESGTPETNESLSGQLPAGSYSKVRFSLGVPFEFNHIDNATAPAPLNTPGMYWVWKGGYKFFRVDWKYDDEGDTEVPRYNIHLGSTGCESPAPTTPPEERCKNSNIAKFEFDISSIEDIKIAFDLETMVAKTDLTTNIMDTPPGCQSNPMESGDCLNIFQTLGLNFETGSCDNNCEGQSAVTITK